MFFGKKREKEEIREKTAQDPDSPEYRVKCLRYGRHPEKKKADLFIRAFMMINVAFKNDLHGFSPNAGKRDLEKNLRQLGVLDYERDDLLRAEWRDMAHTYLESCLKSREYGSAFSGLIHPSDERVAHMIIEDIDTTLRMAPARFKYEEECRELFEIFRDCYFEMVADGETIWDGYMKKIKNIE